MYAVQEDCKTLKTVAPSYAGRESLLTAALQYVYQTIRLGGSGMTEEGRAIERLAGDALRDFEILGTLIGKLGASPVFTACPPYPVSYHSSACVDYARSYPLMLAADIRLEQSLIRKFGEAQAALEDPAAVEVVRELLLHAQERLLKLQTYLGLA